MEIMAAKPLQRRLNANKDWDCVNEIAGEAVAKTAVVDFNRNVKPMQMWILQKLWEANVVR